MVVRHRDVDPGTVAMELAALLVSVVLGGTGLYLAHNLRRQQRLKVAEKRMESYGELWKLMEIARPSRLTAWERAWGSSDPREGSGALTRDEARSLYRSFTHWYLGTAHGMLLTETTKRLYLETKASLGRYAADKSPHWAPGGERVMRQLSMLRQQMKLDLDLYGVSYYAGKHEDENENENEDEKERKKREDDDFLRSAGIDPGRWARRPWRQRLAAPPPGRERRGQVH
jgi:hypothetical protein